LGQVLFLCGESPTVIRTLKKINLSSYFLSTRSTLYKFVEKVHFSKASQKCPDARRPKSRRVRRTFDVRRNMKDEGNAADGVLRSLPRSFHHLPR